MDQWRLCCILQMAKPRVRRFWWMWWRTQPWTSEMLLSGSSITQSLWVTTPAKDSFNQLSLSIPFYWNVDMKYCNWHAEKKKYSRHPAALITIPIIMWKWPSTCNLPTFLAIQVWFSQIRLSLRWPVKLATWHGVTLIWCFTLLLWLLPVKSGLGCISETLRCNGPDTWYKHWLGM